ncbi:MAG: serine--tRNA ligase, partial [Blastocatellia bacterium]|nr:serine--tRNA ligase [Blastocatellia bacterium]
MLDLQFVRENFDQVREKLATRNFDPALLDDFTRLDAERRSLIRERDELNSISNRLSKEVGALMREGKKDEAEAKKTESRQIAEQAKTADVKVVEFDNKFREILVSVPNLPHESVPVGKDESANVEVRKWGSPRDFKTEGFAPRDHVDLGAALGILDQERATKVTGARFAVLNGLGAKMERALINFMLDLHTGEHGYREVLPPFIVNADTLFGTGQLPKFEADLFKLTDERGFYLVPTAEVPLTNLHRDEILSEKELTLS